MPKVLVVADASWVRNEVHATLTASEYELIDHSIPETVAEVAIDEDVVVVIADLQIGAMGGMAVTRSVREATGDAESPGLPVILLLDRSADTFLAKRAGAAAWLTKPFTSGELESALSDAMSWHTSMAGEERESE